MTWWFRGFVGLVGAVVALDLPRPVATATALAALGCFALSYVRPPRSSREAVAVRSPVRGRWVPVNSPGTKVPSHGGLQYGQQYAVDVLHPTQGVAPRVGWGVVGARPESSSCFGEPVLAVADGTVTSARDGQRDHRNRDSWPLLALMFTVEGLLRTLAGPGAVVGNHVVLDHGDGTWSVYAHLRRGSVRVRTGDRVSAGAELGEVGNTGNTTEPHLHWQLVDDPRLERAAGLPWCWTDARVQPDDVDRRWGDGSRGSGRGMDRVPVEGTPPNGQVFEVEAARTTSGGILGG